MNNKVDEINIIFISDFEGITFFHYMDEQKSMLCRKSKRNFIEENFGELDFNWLPICFTHLKT